MPAFVWYPPKKLEEKTNYYFNSLIGKGLDWAEYYNNESKQKRERRMFEYSRFPMFPNNRYNQKYQEELKKYIKFYLQTGREYRLRPL